MKVETRQSGDVTILVLTGEITIGVSDVELRNAAHEALDGGARKLLLDLAGVTVVDSSGIGELVSSYTRTSNRGGTLKLLNVPPKVYDILAITQLITIFETYDNEQEAIASFS